MDVLVLGIALTDATLAVHEFAHSLHLDIKPDNVLLRPSRKSSSSPSLQVPVLTDFGLMHKLPSRVQESLPSETSKSLVSGVGEGTPGYAAPEQGEGRGGKKSDVYSIGATLVFAASYERPFGKKASAVAIAKKFLQGATVFFPFCVACAQLDVHFWFTVCCSIAVLCALPTSCLCLRVAACTCPRRRVHKMRIPISLFRWSSG